MDEQLELPEDQQFSDPRLENEIKKIKLALEHGGKFIIPGEGELPADVEGQWLDYIKQFEDQLSKRKKILLYDLIERPQFPKTDTLTDADLPEQLARIKDLLHNHSIVVDSTAGVPDREMYRFITEELFNEETNDIQVTGLITCFVYEEYHPNHEYDIRNRCTEFVNHVLDKTREWAPGYLGLADELYANNGILSKTEVTNKIINFRDSFSRLVIMEFRINTVHINGTDATAECYINCNATLEDSQETMNFYGDCIFALRYQAPRWVITRLDIPGLRM